MAMEARSKASSFACERKDREASNDAKAAPDMEGPHGNARAHRQAVDPSEVLALLIEAAERQLNVDKVLIFSLDVERGVLKLEGSSRAARPAKDSASEVLLRRPRGLLAECAMSAEKITIRSTEEIASQQDAALLRSLGPEVLLVPLLGRKGLRCWRELSCPQRDCPAYEADDARCWLMSGTVCRDGRPRGPDEKLAWCLRCPAFAVVGVISVGVSGRADIGDLGKDGRFSLLADHMGAAIEAAQTARALIRLNTELEARVAAAVEELAEANDTLVRSEKLAATGRLVAGLAHQVNNPLAVISTCVQSLRMGGSDAEAAARSLEMITIEVQRLTRLFHNLLDFARDQRLLLTEVDLRDLIGQSAQLVLPLAQRSDVAVHLAKSDSPRATVDRALMQQVLVNLLANAIQAAPKGGRVDVKVREGPTTVGQGRTVDIIVEDNGPGMEAKVLAKAFEPLFTTKSHSGGVGLGLSLSLSIVERHGGTIFAKSSPGEGAAFTVRLPSA